MKTEARRMIRDVLAIAKREGLCDDSLERELVVRLANREGRSYGGRKGGKPYISIAMRSVGWWYTPDDPKLDRLLKAWGRATGRKRDRVMVMLNRAKAGEGIWGEYASIANDPEIGTLYGDPADKLKPLAAVICHEIAHVIDWNCGALEIAGRKYGPAGSNHKNKWRAIYRLLRNAYVATGAYKPAPTAEIIEFKPTPRTTEPLELIGLPLFDIAA